MATKATVDNTIQFQGYNTIKMGPNTVYRCTPYAVEGMASLSHSFWVYSTSPLTSVTRAWTQFYGTNGRRLGVPVTHNFAVTGGVFGELKIEGVVVPTGAVRAELRYVNTANTVTYWASKPKSEEGERATPYAANFTGQMTFLTPTGGYIGLLSTNQIVVSGLEKLDTRLVTINNSLVNLSSTTGSLSGRLTTNETSLTALGARVSSVETVNGQQTTSIANLQAGHLTINSNTLGVLAGMALSSDRLQFNTTGRFARIMAKPGFDFLQSGPSSSQLNFRVTETGVVYAEDVHIKGTVKAGSVINGQLNSTTGTHTGSINSGGTFSGGLSGVTGTTGAISGSSFSGGTYGSHYGYQEGNVWSGSGTLGGTPYSTTYGRLNFGGTLGASRLTGAYDYGDVSLSSNRVTTTFLTVTYPPWGSGSDRHYKEDIKPIDRELILNNLRRIDVTSFKFIAEPDKPQIGIIANDLIGNFPEEFNQYVISPNHEGYLQANYGALSMMTLVGYQELHERVKALEERIA